MAHGCRLRFPRGKRLLARECATHFLPEAAWRDLNTKLQKCLATSRRRPKAAAGRAPVPGLTRDQKNSLLQAQEGVNQTETCWLSYSVSSTGCATGFEIFAASNAMTRRVPVGLPSRER